MSDTRTADEIVTDHCALRYLQRVLEVNIGTINPTGESKRLYKICRDLGITGTMLKAKILSPTVRAALAIGAEKVLADGVWFALNHGRVATVLDPGLRHKTSQRNRSRGKRFTFSPQVPPGERASGYVEEDAL